MNTTNILLATTSILIVVAFGLSLKGFSDDRENPDSREELAELKKEMEQLEAERRAFELSQLRAAAPPTLPVDQAAATPDGGSLDSIAPGTATTTLDDEKQAELEDKIAELEANNRLLEKEKEDLYEERNQIKEQQMKAAKRIGMALDMGTVVSASKEHATVIYEPSPSAPNHQPGTVLAVRRQSGILGEIEIDRLDPSGQYIATMRPQVYAPDGYPDIRPGDTIIVDPNK